MDSLEGYDALLPPELLRQAGPPAAPPRDFEEGYVLPSHYDKPLQQLHRHPNDDHLVFYEEPHVYTYKGVPTSASVTGVAHQFEDEFDPAKAIQLMKTSRKQVWPRLAYVHGSRPLLDGWSPDRGALWVRDGLTVSVVHPHSLADGADVRQMLYIAKIRPNEHHDPDVDEPMREDELFVYDRALSDTEITDKWARDGLIARNKGTEAHLLAELFFNGLPFRYWESDMRSLADLCCQHLLPRGMIAYNTEKEIVYPEADLAGSIDLILYEPARDLYHIVDHKRSDKLKADLRGFRKMKVFTHLDDCKGAAYALQTSIYQYILTHEYGMRFGSRVLVSLHPDKPFATSVPYLEAEVEYLMQQRCALVRARRAVAEANPDRFRCTLTKAPAVDAVRLPHGGGIAMHKAALLSPATSEALPDEEVRRDFEAAVAAELAAGPPVLPRKKDMVAWRLRMPTQGLTPFADSAVEVA